MKKAIIIFMSVFLFPIFGVSQTTENLDFISSFNEGFSAIRNGDDWAFINEEGVIIVNFRNDLVTTKSLDGNYPIFKNDRCLIKIKKDGILYFGYINTSGKTVVEPRFLNASNFNNNVATVLELEKEVIAKNTALDKNVVYYKYYEVTIDTSGNIKNYLTQNGVNIVLDKSSIRKPPQFLTKQISENLVAIKNKKGKWMIKKIIE